MKTITNRWLVVMLFAMLALNSARSNPGASFACAHSKAGGDAGMSTLADPVQYSYETLSNGTVKLTVLNTGTDPVSGDLIREAVTYPQNGEILTNFLIPAGAAYTYIDDRVLPGKSYVYIFEYYDQGTSEYYIHFDTITPVSNIPALGNFLLIASYEGFDDEYDWLREGYTIVIRGTNIQAEANPDKTGSVVFYLNGKQSKDNTAPFALFQEVRGDFKKGHLKNGDYTLTAIAYPLKNGKGIPGDTLTVNFSVDNIYDMAKVDVYPNPVKGNSTVLVEGTPDSDVSIHASGLSGTNRKMIYQGKLDSSGKLERTISSGDFRKGIWVLRVTVDGTVIEKRIVIE